MIFFFAKFLAKEAYVHDVMAGRLHVNRLACFKDFEEEATCNRGDRHEGVVHWLQPDGIRLVLNGRDLTPDLAGPVEIGMSWLNHIHVFCLHAAHSGSLDLTDLTSGTIDGLREKLEIPSECRQLGEHAIIIRNVRQFIDRIETAAKLKDHRVHRGLVRYYNPDTFHGRFDGIEAAFRKRDEYRHQREYRFAIDTRTTGVDPLILNIGDISDIAIPCKTATINDMFLRGSIEIKRPSRGGAI
ncbi:hypothetical protein [Candidatus Palauibacter sp.]|uniref:hypothetical protein n=1 Tax=Candidatus Palauibacter sp. TaxID=3101350 RepID=UPI003B5A2D69